MAWPPQDAQQSVVDVASATARSQENIDYGTSAQEGDGRGRRRQLAGGQREVF